ncbi:unnamed protein product, partial [Hymenolepis diminuta]
IKNRNNLIKIIKTYIFLKVTVRKYGGKISGINNQDDFNRDISLKTNIINSEIKRENYSTKYRQKYHTNTNATEENLQRKTPKNQIKGEYGGNTEISKLERELRVEQSMSDDEWTNGWMRNSGVSGSSEPGGDVNSNTLPTLSTSTPIWPSTTVESHSNLSGGAIAGIVIGVVAGLAIIGCIIWLIVHLAGRERKPKYFILDRSDIKDSVSIDRLKPAYLELPDVNPNSAIPKLFSFVSSDNVHSPSTRAESSSKDTIQPSTPSVQSSLQDLKSTTPPSYTSRIELSLTHYGRRVNFPFRLPDYVQ